MTAGKQIADAVNNLRLNANLGGLATFANIANMAARCFRWRLYFKMLDPRARRGDPAGTTSAKELVNELRMEMHKHSIVLIKASINSSMPLPKDFPKST